MCKAIVKREDTTTRPRMFCKCKMEIDKIERQKQ